MTFYKGELRKGDQVILQEVDVSIQTNQLIVPRGKKLKIDLTDPSFELKLKDGNLFTIYIEKRTASYTPQGSVELYTIRSIPSIT